MRHHLLHRVPDTETNRHNRMGLVLDLVPIVAAHGNKPAVLRNRVHLDSDIRQVEGIGKMNFKHEICEWSEHKFIRVSEKRYDNFIRYFENLNRIEGNSFMDWHDSYDWSLREKKHPIGSWEAKADCKVARCYFGGPKSEYWIRLDYIEANGYDIDTIVPKPRRRQGNDL